MSNKDLEARYAAKFRALFAQVFAKQPEKGIRTLINRAYGLVQTQNLSLEEALESVYTDAAERTARRVALFSRCELKKP